MTWRAIEDTVAWSESLAALSDPAERLFWRLLAYSDSWGRLTGVPAKVKARCVPLLGWKDERVETLLEELEEVSRITRYETPRGMVIQIMDFDEHQPKEYLRRRGASKYPAPAKALQNGTTPGVVRSAPEDSRLEEKRREEKRRVLNRTSTPSSDKSDVADVFEHWRSTRQKSDRLTLTPGRRDKIRARLKEFSPDELRRAIDAVQADPWSERYRYDDIPQLFGSREKVERWLALADGALASLPELTEPA